MVAVLLAGCGDDDGGGGRVEAFPVPDWAVVAPAEQDMDAAALERFASYVETENSDCLVVVRGGRIVGEWYWRGFEPDSQRGLASVTKSLTSTLVGIAQDRGLLSIDEPASRYIEEWVGTASEGVTIRNLLSNDSGRFWSLAEDYGPAEDVTAAGIRLEQEFPPGTRWEYNNRAIQTLERVLEVAVGGDVVDFAREALFDPIGMSFGWSRDSVGNPRLSGGAQTGCRDLARFGLLFLREGRWANGAQVVSSEWVHEATDTASTPLNAAYGLLWWLNRDGHWVLPTTLQRNAKGDGLFIPQGPDDSYAAVGVEGQLAVVVPSLDLVYTRLGSAPNGDAQEQLLGTTLIETSAALLDEAILR